jgi:hypothetical protein
VQDIGHVALGFRLLEKLVDLNFLFTLASPIMHLMPDFKQQIQRLKDGAGNSGAGAAAGGSRSTK